MRKNVRMWMARDTVVMEIPISKECLQYVYIEPDGRIWTQFCDPVTGPDACDSGVEIDVKQFYEDLRDALTGETRRWLKNPPIK